MKRCLLLLSTLLLLQFNLQLAAYANAVTFKPASDSAPATLQGHVPINKVGALLAADTLAILNGDEITIQQSHVPDPQKPDLFKGQILKSKIETLGDTKNLSGIAYFNGGTRFDKLANAHCDESVTLTDGQNIKGIIQSADKIQLAIKTSSALQTVKMADVSSIHSPRAFNFSMNIPKGTDIQNPDGFSAELGRLTLNPTCHTINGGVTSSSTTKKIIIIAVAVTLVATAIAVPIAVGCATHHHHHPYRPPYQQQGTVTPTQTIHPVTTVVGRPVTVLGTKTATAALPPRYATTLVPVNVPPVFRRGVLIRPGYTYNVLKQVYIGR